MINDEQTEIINITEIKPVDYNPRSITEDSLVGLINSIKEFGIVDPFIINKRTGNLVGGHQRLKAAIELKIENVPVRYVNISPSKEKVLNITLNNPKISGHFNFDLKKLLSDINFELPDLDLSILRLDNLASLIVSDEWSTDFGAVEKAGENLDGILAKIIIECPQEVRQEMLEFVRDTIGNSHFHNAHVK